MSDCSKFDTVAEAAARLKVSEVTVRRMLADGTLPFAKLGKSPQSHVRILVADILALRHPSGGSTGSSGGGSHA